MDPKKLLSNTSLIIIMSVLFVCWLLFFDQNSYVDLRGLDAKIEELKKERNFYLDKIAEDSMVIKNITDSAFLERYAREHFFFTREGETMYIFEDDTAAHKAPPAYVAPKQ